MRQRLNFIMPLIILSVVLILSCSSVFGVVTLLVRGKVTDAATKAPIAGAEISFRDLDMGKVIKIKTDKSGEYVQRLQWASYKVTIKCEGYVPQEYPQLAKPAEGDETTVDFKLQSGKGYLASELTPEEKAKLEKEEAERKKAEQLTGSVKKLFDEAIKAKEAKDLDGAIAKLKEAEALSPTQPAIAAHLGDCYLQKNNIDDAIIYFKKAVEASPKDGALRTNLGNAYVKKNMMKEAQEQFEAAVQNDPLHADLNYFNMGVVYFNAGNIDSAAQAFKSSIEANKNYSASYYQLALCLLNKGDAKGSLNAMETYLKLDPNGAYSAQAKSLIPEVKKMIN